MPNSKLPSNDKNRRFARWLLAMLPLCPAWVGAQPTDPLPPQTQLVALSRAPAATEETFTIAAAASGSQPDLLVTFTDLQTPAPLATANVVVTQGDSIVGTSAWAAPAAAATVALHAAVGQFTLRVIGTPGAVGVGTFSVCVAPTATPSACIQNASTVGNITVQSAAADPTLSTFAGTLKITTQGLYTFTYADNQFPVALGTAPNLALFQGSQPIAAPIPASPAAITLNPGTYTLLAFAQADPVAKSGLYGIKISGPAGGVAPLLNGGVPDNSYPVGLLRPASTQNNPSAQSLTLTVTDFAFPAPLASASALVTSGATSLKLASAGSGPLNFAAPAGPLQVWSYGAAGTGGTTAGTYQVDLASASASLVHPAFGVNGGSSFAYAYVWPGPSKAGSYVATGNDFNFPTALASVQFAVAQNGAVLKQESAVGSLDFTAAAGPVVLLVDATPAANMNGMFDVNVQTSGGQLSFDQVQPVSAVGGFTSQPITLGTSGNFDVTLTDLNFPAMLQTLAMVGTSNGKVLGNIYGGGTFTIAATPGDYQFTIAAIPAAAQQYGLYGIQIVNSVPTVKLTASPTSVTAGGLTTLSWTTTNATACTASGGAFTGNPATGSGSVSVAVSATTTYTLTCTGPGGSASGTASVTATSAPATSGGGGRMGWDFIAVLALLAVARMRLDLRMRRIFARPI